MEWIALCDYLPSIPEDIELSDGPRISQGYCINHESDTVYVICEMQDFTPLWWRPIEGSIIEKDFEGNTFSPSEPNLFK